MLVLMIDQAILQAALEGLAAQQAKLDEQIRLVRALASGGKKRGPKPKTAASTDGEAPAEKKKRRKKRVMSPEGKARIAAAQQKRWAAVRKAKG